jgi:ABC-type uncharacterized transport system auxiliary subunit
MMMRTMLAASAALMAAGCISILPDAPPAPYTYTMRAGEVTPAGVAAKPQVISVGAPSTQRMAGGADIVWRTGPEVAVMEGVAWDDSAPDLLQLMLAETLDRRGAFRAALRSGSGARGDLELRWDVLAFEVVEDGALEAVFNANVRLIDARSRAVLETKRIETRAPIASRSGRLAAAALEKVAQEACLQIADWAAEKAPVLPTPPVVSDQSQPAALSQPSAASTKR